MADVPDTGTARAGTPADAMITPGYVRTMARYNAWQNGLLFAACDTLSDKALRQDRRAFFGSVFATLNHLYWGNRIWMNRFAAVGAPKGMSIDKSVKECADWPELKAAQTALDAEITAWADQLTAVAGDLVWYSGATDSEQRRPLSYIITHFFNHQTHHRGQVHAMLTAAGHPGYVSDLAFMPEELRG